MSNFDIFKWMKVVWTVVAALVFVSSGDTGTATITPERVDRFIEYATSYLVRISHTAEQDPKHPGHFTYIAHLGKTLQLDGFDQYPQTSYNLLRHNGAIYSLALAYERRPDEQVKEAMLRGIGYLKNEAIEPVPDTQKGDGQLLPDLLAPFETLGFRDMTFNNRKRAKLGGAGLSLIALCLVERIVPGTTGLAYLRKIGNFIQYLQKDDGSFASRFDSWSGKDDSWTSLYYPGEAALGLVYLFELETDDVYRRKWLEIATHTLLYLERLRRKSDLSDIEPDHWALLASSRLLSHFDSHSVEYGLVYSHAVRVVQRMIALHTEEQLVKENGCFTFDRRTCPTATRLEGLLAAYTFIKDDEMLVERKGQKVLPLRERMMHDIQLGIEFMLQAQQQTDQANMKGAVPVRFPMKSERDMEVRVDYVQHSMSAVLAYEAIMIRDQPASAVTTTKLESGARSTLTWLTAVFLLVAVVILTLSFNRKKKSRRYNE